jgi:hypothetical protein
VDGGWPRERPPPSRMRWRKLKLLNSATSTAMVLRLAFMVKVNVSRSGAEIFPLVIVQTKGGRRAALLFDGNAIDRNGCFESLWHKRCVMLAP